MLQNGDVAQLGERMLCKHNVASSILVISTRFGGIAQLVEHLTFNQVVVGSSPAAPTKSNSPMS